MSGGSGHPPSRSLFGQCIIDDLGSAFFVLTKFNWWCSKSNLQMRVWCRSGGGGRVEVATGEGGRWWRSGGGGRGCGVSAGVEGEQGEEVVQTLEDMGSCLFEAEVSQTFFNERSARKQTSCRPLCLRVVCAAQT
ncbi:hypothetical protein Hanom_Chr06g00577841 [Helianthus anomalus]